MYDIITIGDIKLDTFVVIDDASVQCGLKMPECKLCLDYGAKIAVDVVDSQTAGSAPNVAIGISRMGKKAALKSVTGEDSTRQMALDHLKKEKVNTSLVAKDKDDPSSYSVVLNYKGDKTILTSHIKHTYKLTTKMPKSKWYYVCEMGYGYEGFYKAMAAHIKKNGYKLAMNPGGIQVEEKKKVLYNLIKQLDILFINTDEARTILGTKTSEAHQLATGLFKLGAKMVVMTDGIKGAYGFDGETLWFCPIFPGKRVEATGAGDSFATGVLGAIMHGKDMETALKWGSVNAASVVHEVGPTAGLLSRNQIITRLRKHPSYKVKKM